MDYSEIILELLNRIKQLEKDVSELKQGKALPVITERPDPPYAPQMQHPTKRDTSRYLFEGNVYLKNRLVLAVVHAYLKQNPTITRQELKQVFNKSLQGSIGVVENADVAHLRTDYSVRFFIKEDEILHLTDGDMYVCTQWGILNIPYFLTKAQSLGFDIKKIEN